MDHLIHDGRAAWRWLYGVAVGLAMFASAGAQNVPSPVMVRARVFGQVLVEFTLNEPSQYSGSGQIAITPDTTDTQAFAGFNVTGGNPTGYGVTFRANYSISISGSICTGSNPNPCATTQPCNLSASTSGEVIVPIQAASIPGATHSIFLISEGNPQSLNPVVGVPCNDLFLASILSTPNTSSFPVAAISFDCPPQRLCQAKESVVPDSGSYSPPSGDPVVNAQYTFNLQICLGHDSRCPTLEIADADTGAVLSTSDTAQSDKVVGQLINLQVQSDPPQQSPPDIQWTLPQEPIAISDYELTQAEASIKPIADDDLKQSQIKFYWTQGGTQSLKVSATLKASDGLSWPSTAFVDYDVGRPQLSGGNSFAITGVQTTATVSNGSWDIQEGDGKTTPGATFSAQVQGAQQASGEGQIVLLQVITSPETCTLNGSPVTGGTTGVDYDPQYGTPSPFISQEQPIYSFPVFVNGQDSPIVTIGAGSSTGDVFSVNASFNLYVMYQPSGGIWVTLAQAQWNWTATATWKGNAWTVPTVAPSSVYGADSTTLPTWSQTAHGCG